MNKDDQRFCDSRHEPIEKYLAKLDKTQDKIDGRLWKLMSGGFIGMLFLLLNLGVTIVFYITTDKKVQLKKPRQTQARLSEQKLDSLLNSIDLRGK